MRLIRLFASVLLIVFAFGLLLPLRTAALSQADIDSINNDSVWHKVYPKNTCGGTGSATSVTPGPLYLLGDSIGTQFADPLTTSLSADGWSVKANVLSSRNLAGEPPSPDGLGAIAQDQDYIKTATAVVIELGTNAGGFTAENVSQTIDTIRGLTNQAQIFWVDTAVVELQDYAQTLNNVNAIINEQSATKNYKVISWNKKVFGDSADPTNINSSAPDNGYIRRSDQYVHLTPEGITAMTELISGALSGGNTGSSSGSCACTLLTGADNGQKIWNYLIQKGLTTAAVAGIMGNLQAESGFNPKRVQNTSTPDGDQDNITVDGVTGYGIAQWTSAGRQQGLADAAAARSIISGDLGVQLDWLWQELTTSYVGVYDQIKDSTDIAMINTVFGHQYEGYGTDTESLRLGFANTILTDLGSLSGNSSGGSCS